MYQHNNLTDGLNNWKLRLILSALLCILGLGALVSMSLGLFMEISVYDRSMVSIAIFMVGVPAYLIISNLANIDESTIAGFLNANLDIVDGKAEVLLIEEADLSEEDLEVRKELEAFFEETPLYHFLPDKPVKQAYFLFLMAMIASFIIWYIG